MSRSQTDGNGESADILQQLPSPPMTTLPEWMLLGIYSVLMLLLMLNSYVNLRVPVDDVRHQNVVGV